MVKSKSCWLRIRAVSSISATPEALSEASWCRQCLPILLPTRCFGRDAIVMSSHQKHPVPVWSFARQRRYDIPHHVFAEQVALHCATAVQKGIKFDFQTVTAKLLCDIIRGVVAGMVRLRLPIELLGFPHPQRIATPKERSKPC